MKQKNPVFDDDDAFTWRARQACREFHAFCVSLKPEFGKVDKAGIHCNFFNVKGQWKWWQAYIMPTKEKDLKLVKKRNDTLLRHCFFDLCAYLQGRNFLWHWDVTCIHFFVGRQVTLIGHFEAHGEFFCDQGKVHTQGILHFCSYRARNMHAHTGLRIDHHVNCMHICVYMYIHIDIYTYAYTYVVHRLTQEYGYIIHTYKGWFISRDVNGYDYTHLSFL